MKNTMKLMALGALLITAERVQAFGGLVNIVARAEAQERFDVKNKTRSTVRIGVFSGTEPNRPELISSFETYTLKPGQSLNEVGGGKWERQRKNLTKISIEE